MAHPKLQQVRQRFDYCCEYCGVSEIESGGELTVDHFIPIEKGGSDELDNLVYTCFRCNIYKTDFVPTAVHLAAGRRVLHPLNDTVDDHYRLDIETGELIALTPTGTFHIALLQLNRPRLKTLRQRKHLAQKFLQYVGDLQEDIIWFREQIQAQERYRQKLQEEISGEEH